MLQRNLTNSINTHDLWYKIDAHVTYTTIVHAGARIYGHIARNRLKCRRKQRSTGESLVDPRSLSNSFLSSLTYLHRCLCVSMYVRVCECLTRCDCVCLCVCQAMQTFKLNAHVHLFQAL